MSSINDITILERYFLICAALLVLFLVSILIRKRFAKKDKCDDSFRNNPAQYHRHYVACYGRIERILKDRLAYKIRRRIRNLVCSLLNSSSQYGRCEHQRFIILSPQIKKNETMLITHNVKFGKVSIKEGDWVKVCGEYIHRQG